MSKMNITEKDREFMREANHSAGMQETGHLRPVRMRHLHLVRALPDVPRRHLLG